MITTICLSVSLAIAGEADADSIRPDPAALVATRRELYEAQRMRVTSDGKVVDSEGRRIPIETLFVRLGDEQAPVRYRTVRRRDKATWTPVMITGGVIMAVGGFTSFAGTILLFYGDDGRTLGTGLVTGMVGFAGVWTGIVGGVVSTSRRNSPSYWYHGDTLGTEIDAYDRELRETLSLPVEERAGSVGIVLSFDPGFAQVTAYF